MNRAERLQAHQVQATWMPYPEGHLQSPRDRKHFEWTCAQLFDLPGASVLDIGCWDGWLDFLLIREGYKVRGVELIPELCHSAMRYADAHKLEYMVHNGFFHDLKLEGFAYDAALCYEVLEHIPLDMVLDYVAKMEMRATQRILISLPDQRMEDNPQHLWTPNLDVIQSLWGERKGFHVEYQDYPGTDIPPNYMIRWEL